MNRHVRFLRPSSEGWLLLAGSGLAMAVAEPVVDPGGTLELTYAAFVLLAGFVMGSLGLLMIGHLMSEHWVAPIRSEAEAAALTAPLLLVFGIPLAFKLGALFPWADPSTALPEPQAFLLSPGFFALRGALYLVVCSGLAIWLVRTRHLRRTSAVGLALVAPLMTLAAYDWVLSRDPGWWSSLFGFAFALSQLLAALAGAILITLLRPEHASLSRMQSLERALLTLALLSVWTWFSQFLIVWLSNLPREVAWYLERSDAASLGLIGAAFAAMSAAILVLIPSGVSRRGMIAGSLLILLQHVLHLLWIVQPGRVLRWPDLILAIGFAALWGSALILLMRSRPIDSEGMLEDPERQRT